MVARRIIFPSALLSNATIAAAIAADGGSPELDGQLAEIMDEKSDDYPNLRLHLTNLKQPYDFHQRRANDGDNVIWHHGRNGVEHLSNYGEMEDGQAGIMPLRYQRD
jgi:hypothetical protein